MAHNGIKCAQFFKLLVYIFKNLETRLKFWSGWVSSIKTPVVKLKGSDVHVPHVFPLSVTCLTPTSFAQYENTLQYSLLNDFHIQSTNPLLPTQTQFVGLGNVDQQATTWKMHCLTCWSSHHYHVKWSTLEDPWHKFKGSKELYHAWKPLCT